MFKTIFSSFDKNKNPSEEEINKIPSFIYCRYLSGHPSTISMANTFNFYHAEIPVINQYKMVKSQFSGQRLFIKMPKIPKEEVTKRIEIIQTHFNLSEAKAKDYLEVMNEEEINNLIEIYTTQRN